MTYTAATDTTHGQAVTSILREHRIECTGPGEVTCRGCRDLGWMDWPGYFRHVTSALIDADLIKEHP